MAKLHKVRDPVHNFVQLEQDEIKLVDTPIFQRLRGIRQLAMANLVYPGALHTRFDHSLGVCHVAGLMADELGLPDHDKRLVRLAALLHDLGHGPFSHVSEISVERFADRSNMPPELKKEKIHELVTARFNGDVREKLPPIMKPDRAANRERLEEAVGEAIPSNPTGKPIDKRLVIVNAFDIKSVRIMSRNDEGGILVERPGGPRPFEEESALFRSIAQGYSESFVEVYAPISWDTPTRRKQLKNSLDRPIRDAIEAFFNPESMNSGGAK